VEWVVTGYWLGRLGTGSFVSESGRMDKIGQRFKLATHSVVFSPDGTRLVTGNGAGVEALKLWDTDSWQDVITLQGSGSVFYEPAFSPDGNSVGALSEAGILHVWRAPSWAEIEKAEASDNQSTTP
jgi:WD40 repeat protein